MFLAIFNSCQIKDPLPEPTQTGANTFGCKIDGENWIPNGAKGFMAPGPVEGGFARDIIFKKGIVISVTARSKDGKAIHLFVFDSKVGKYLLNRDTTPYQGYLKPVSFASYHSGKGVAFATDSLHTGYIEITKADTTTGTVSGTFEFEAGPASNLATGTHKVTKGRFDVNYAGQ
ncbi:hypothetical protein GCM10007390_23420 [Persicitalea jodogahamensis]|uniref:Uncharacterized protein n=1 Tax=Persicitalea jodogahamensis TaxID=402147 RepID=A0A8J3G9T5_9BACT|nr:hypothetical protein GCM10007390_23420 [Persicitalea jodogahamensis]